PSPAKPGDVVARARPRPETGSSRPQPAGTTDTGVRRLEMPGAAAPQPDRALAIAPPAVSRPAPAPVRPAAAGPEIAPEEPWVPEWTSGTRRHRAARASSLGEPRPVTTPSGPPAPAADVEVESRPRLEVLVWAADPEKRMVYLNGRRYVQGEALQN